MLERRFLSRLKQTDVRYGQRPSPAEVRIKHRMVEYLVAEQGFTVFAFEANQPECRAIDDYVLHGTGNARAALGGVFQVWYTEEVLAVIE